MLLCPRTRKLFVGHKLVTCFLYPMTKYIKIVPRDLKKKALHKLCGLCVHPKFQEIILLYVYSDNLNLGRGPTL